LEVCISRLEFAMYKIIPNTINVLKQMKKDFKQSGNIDPDPCKETFFTLL